MLGCYTSLLLIKVVIKADQSHHQELAAYSVKNHVST